jgi:hypothetical protein
MTNPRRNLVSTISIIQIVFIVFTIFCFTNAFPQTELSKDIRTVLFRDGTIIQGQVVQLNVDTITIWTPGDDIIIRNFDDIESFDKKDIFDLYNSPQVGSDTH